MGKGTNFSGQPVLSQLIKLMDRSKINTLASHTQVPVPMTLTIFGSIAFDI